MENVFEQHLPAIDAAIIDADRAGVPLAEAGVLILALTSELAPALLAAFGVQPPAAPYLALAMRGTEIEAMAAKALAESAPTPWPTFGRSREPNGLGCFVFDRDGVMFAPGSRAPSGQLTEFDGIRIRCRPAV